LVGCDEAQQAPRPGDGDAPLRAATILDDIGLATGLAHDHRLAHRHRLQDRRDPGLVIDVHERHYDDGRARVEIA
jgi:hypothetical protein